MARTEINNCYINIENTDLGDGPRPGTSHTSIGNRLHFSNLPPDVGTSKSASITPIHILGRSSPLYVYGYSDERSWNLELKFFAEEQTVARPEDSLQNRFTDGINNEVRQQVLDKVNWCESLVHPIYKNGISKGLPRLTFVFGDMLNVRVICESVQTSFPGPWFTKSSASIGYPLHAIVNLTLKQNEDHSFSHLDVRSNIHNGVRVNT